ncbi:P-loop containing nucleoside triphosphate hydrolase protein [Aspergillus transmontanensis]|uniref:P-loop containing nucleoside triphosphate hydrolase protein n=1 Tax=Aspergillus transmontanensis TaxID=1034304 RepID=A0A5N6WBA9_9EURO|nr:P-loop containing nucleoside triphosphate hydrolase protein [Aspergillus transmontanensis]
MVPPARHRPLARYVCHHLFRHTHCYSTVAATSSIPAGEAHIDLSTPLAARTVPARSTAPRYQATAFPYEELYQHVLDKKKKDQSYRYFRSITRLQDQFPLARCNRTGKKVDVWCSNDYLAMGSHPAVISAMEDALHTYGANSGGSRNIAGHSSLVETLEASIAELHKKPSALYFSSGFARESIHSIFQASAFYALSQSITFLCAALAFWYGGTLLSKHEYTVVQFFICFSALISGAQTAGVIFSYAPGMSKAMGAARDLRTLFNRRPTIDTWDTSGKPFDKKASSGRIEFRNVSFSYPSRPERVVVNNFNLTVQPGQFVALVGASGCGKSTLIGLLERFSDPTSGQILLDDQDISTLDVASYRSAISLVGQEPTLFSGSIRENLLLGTVDDVSEDEIVQACVKAHIYEVVMSVPNGFATDLGSKGIMLSGGQKQRLAIARALLRNTKILLLDEATAALDSRSEAMVQEALNKASEKRTTIAVAHRLSTIQHADVICVLEAGRMVEVGNHRELMRKEGVYAGMVEMQNRGMGFE